MRRYVSLLLLCALLLGCASAEPAQDVASDAMLDPDAVKMLQINLIGGGYLDGDADGRMGSQTQKAIRAAQEDLGLEVNGLMSDELTEALLEKAMPMELGDRNSRVYELQSTLSRLGFLVDEPTGYFGDSTEEAVESFQKLALDDFVAYMQSKSDAEFAAMDVADDVVVDVPLYNADSVDCDGVMTEDWYYFLNNEYKFPRIVAEKGDKSEGVKMVQKRLHALGYLYRGFDGVLGDGTQLALKYFQRKSGLPETGEVDDATSEALFSADAPESEEYVMPYMAYVRRWESRVYIFGWDGEGYNERVVAFRCSCGKPSTPTLEGTYYCVGPISDWYYMQDSNTWVRYAFQIKDNYFFHSVLFNSKGARHPTETSLYALGSNVSHGCIRLAVEDAQWIYEHCTVGMKVIIE